MSVIVTDISRSFGDVKALEDISFQTEQGELFGLIGPDGAGKTTLFRILVTLLLADEGEASIEGYNVRTAYREIRKIIGYMPGRFSLYHDLTVRENLEFYATVFGSSIQENYDLVKPVYEHLEPFSTRLAGKLSGGMKQKLALSCALIHRPKVLILDEPTTGVDAVSRKEFWDMLRDICREGITVLVSTPYMDEAALCDRVALVQKGKLLSVSRPSEFSMKEGTALFRFSSQNEIYRYLEKLRSLDESIKAWLFGDEIHVFIEDASKKEFISRQIKQWAVEGLTWEPLQPGVEDFFMQKMAEETA